MSQSLLALADHPFVDAVDYHATLPSTNSRAIELAADPALKTPLVIVAGTQTAGRGRGSNQWWSGPGSVTLSLVIDPDGDLRRHGATPIPVERWPRVALAAAVALCEAIEGVHPQVKTGLKWPNDVLCGGRKVAGILVEVPPAPAGAGRKLVVGIGINVNNPRDGAPPGIQQVATSLCDAAGIEIDAGQLVSLWLTRFAEGLRALAADDPQLASRWQSRCVLAGRSIELVSGERHVRGRCLGIADDGALFVEVSGSIERFYAGVLVRDSG